MARTRSKIHRLVPLFAIFALAGCATAPPPTGLMDRADAQIRAAQAAGADQLAPDEFAEAQRRFAFAQQSIAQGNNEQATASAEEAQAAAETARARARAAALENKIQSQREVNARLQADLEQRQAEAAQAQSAASQPPASAPVQELPPIQLGAPQPGQAPMPAPATSTGMPSPMPASSDGAIPGNDQDHGGTR